MRTAAYIAHLLMCLGLLLLGTSAVWVVWCVLNSDWGLIIRRSGLILNWGVYTAVCWLVSEALTRRADRL